MVFSRFTTDVKESLKLDLTPLEVKGLTYELVEALEEHSECTGYVYDLEEIKRSIHHNTWCFEGETPLEISVKDEEGWMCQEFLRLKGVPVNHRGYIGECEFLLYGMTESIHGDIVCLGRLAIDSKLTYYALER